VDSCVLIGAKRKKDKWHDLARPMVERIAEGKIGVGYIIDYVLVEVVNFLSRKDGPSVAVDALNDLLNSRYLRLIVGDEIGILESLELMKTYKGLSLTDAAIICYMNHINVKYLLSFDSRFDVVPWITRIENIRQLKSALG